MVWWLAVLIEVIVALPKVIAAIHQVIVEVRKHGNGDKVDRKRIQEAVKCGVRSHAVVDKHGGKCGE